MMILLLEFGHAPNQAADDGRRSTPMNSEKGGFAASKKANRRGTCKKGGTGILPVIHGRDLP
jgi:hypothetical protein